VNVDKIGVVGLILTVIAVAMLFILISENRFPTFTFAENNWKPVEISKSIGAEAANFMWNYRSMDVIAQVFVLFGAAVGCLAILRVEEKGRERHDVRS
jgi:multisubunit Na+/H+ antiporter MnhB subunit